MPALAPEKAMRKILKDTGSIFALIGERIYPDFAAEGRAFPWAMMTRASTEPDHHMLGVSGLKYVSVDIVVYDEEKQSLITLAQLFETALDGVNDRTTVTIGAESIPIARLWMTDQSDESVALADGKGRKLYGIRQLYEMHYQN